MEDVEEEAVAALAVGNIEALVVAGQAASPRRQLQAPFGNMVDGRDVLGQPERVTQRQDLDGDPDLDALRARRQGGGDDEGRTASKPKSSAAFICACDSSNAAASVTPGGLWNSVNRPNSIPPSESNSVYPTQSVP